MKSRKEYDAATNRGGIILFWGIFIVAIAVSFALPRWIDVIPAFLAAHIYFHVALPAYEKRRDAQWDAATGHEMPLTSG